MNGLNGIMAASIVAPSDDDWCVRFRFKDGSTAVRRVSPGRIAVEIAIRRATMSLKGRASEVVDCDVFRYAETKRLVIPVS